MDSKNSFSQKIPIAAAALFVLFLLVAVFLVWPKYQEVSRLSQKVEEGNKELQKKESQSLEIKDMKNKLDGYEKELDKINTALPSDFCAPSFFKFIQDTASQSGVVLGSVGGVFSDSSEKSNKKGGDASQEKEEGLREAGTSINVSGSYSAIKNFLFALEKSARIIEISQISFSSSGEEHIFGAELGLRIFAYGE